jgi:hypothetical protein
MATANWEATCSSSATCSGMSSNWRPAAGFHVRQNQLRLQRLDEIVGPGRAAREVDRPDRLIALGLEKVDRCAKFTGQSGQAGRKRALDLLGHADLDPFRLGVGDVHQLGERRGEPVASQPDHAAEDEFTLRQDVDAAALVAEVHQGDHVAVEDVGESGLEGIDRAQRAY